MLAQYISEPGFKVKPPSENENIPRGKNDIMRSSEESHSHPFENKEFRQLCEIKRKKKRIVIARNINAESRLQKVRYMHLRKMKECCFSYRALQLQRRTPAH